LESFAWPYHSPFVPASIIEDNVACIETKFRSSTAKHRFTPNPLSLRPPPFIEWGRKQRREEKARSKPATLKSSGGRRIQIYIFERVSWGVKRSSGPSFGTKGFKKNVRFNSIYIYIYIYILLFILINNKLKLYIFFLKKSLYYRIPPPQLAFCPLFFFSLNYNNTYIYCIYIYLIIYFNK